MDEDRIGEEEGRHTAIVGPQNGGFSDLFNCFHGDRLVHLVGLQSAMDKERIGEEEGRHTAIVGPQNSGFSVEKREALLKEGEKRLKVMREYRSRTIESRLTTDEQNEEFLPGLPNDITLNQIVPKLPWKSFNILSCVSRGWHKTIQSRQVYDARVCSHSTETLMVLDHTLTKYLLREICLYSLTEKRWYRLPLFPDFHSGVPRHSECVSLDGKIYILGGVASDDEVSAELHVLDVAGQTGWKQCANMLRPRHRFGCCVVGGKIYVFGGDCGCRWTPCELNGNNLNCTCPHTCEVFDTKENSWSSIMPMKSRRYDHRVVVIGEELVVYGGRLFDPDDELFGRGADGSRIPTFVEVYNTAKNEWRLEGSFGDLTAYTLLVVEGELHRVSGRRIDVHDIDEKEGPWGRAHSLCSVSDLDFYWIHGKSCSAEVVNGELLVSTYRSLLVLDLDDLDEEDREKILFQAKGFGGGSILFQTKGFGDDDDNIAMEKVDCPLALGACGNEGFMCTIEL